MNLVVDQAEQRTLRSIERRYARQGYRIRHPQRGDEAPAFLGDIRPDLIAESDADKVVVEIRRGDTLRGANDLVELAARVDGQPGWRLEFVALAPVRTRLLSRSEALDHIAHRARDAVRAGIHDVAFGWVAAVIEYLLLDLALARRIKVKSVGMRAVAGHLAVAGVIGSDMFDRIGDVAELRDRSIHALGNPGAPGPGDVVSTDHVEAALALARDIFREIEGEPGIPA